MEEKKNVISMILKFLGFSILIIGGLISLNNWAESYNKTIPFALVIANTVSGMLLVGFGEIIALLQQLNNRFE